MEYKVYMHILPNGKKYVGITSKQNAEERWRNGTAYNNYFKKAIKKYGWDNIQHIILYENLTEEEAKQIEINLIKKYDLTNKNNGYNLSTGGESSKGYKHTKEQIEKQLNNRKPIQYTEEIIEKMREKAHNYWDKEENRQKQSERIKKYYETHSQINKGKKGCLSQTQIEKIKQTRKVKFILCKENNKIYRGTRQVVEELKVDRRTLMRILHKEKGFNSTRGYHFEYIDN